MEAKMRHSLKVHEAMQQAFKELLALSPTELQKKLRARDLGPIGRLLQEFKTIETFPQEYRCDKDMASSLLIDDLYSQIE
ncbi:MAG: hypothetical protein HQK65_03515, partial [Desulfamplus sp.]|nr:hypothetical protein [Desulfamplus sp.]